VETANVKHSLNPFDELAVEEAVRLRERHSGGGGFAVDRIVAISAGGPKCVDSLRTAMAMGADAALHVEVADQNGDGGLEPLTLAKVLQRVVAQEDINLVILGKQAIDGDQGQTGQMLAGLLGWPQATQASRVEVTADAGGSSSSGGSSSGGGTVAVTQEVDGGVATVRARLPLVVTTDLRLNTPRYASLPNIMKAKKKPLERKTLADLGIEPARRLQTVKVTGTFTVRVMLY
jgi:electron transfer flavoprotein beta subunit